MQDLQIKLLYEEYGWSPEQIGALLSISPGIVRLTVEDGGYQQGQLVKSQEDTQQDIEKLKANEVSRQQHIMPIMAAIELSLFAKIMELIKNCESSQDISHMVRAYKTLTQDAITNAVIREEKSSGKGPAIAVQIINEVQ